MEQKRQKTAALHDASAEGKRFMVPMREWRIPTRFSFVVPPSGGPFAAIPAFGAENSKLKARNCPTAAAGGQV